MNDVTVPAPDWLVPHLDAWNAVAETSQLFDWTAIGTLLLFVSAGIAWREWRAAETIRRAERALTLRAWASLARRYLGRARDLTTDDEDETPQFSPYAVRSADSEMGPLIVAMKTDGLPSLYSMEAALLIKGVAAELGRVSNLIVNANDSRDTLEVAKLRAAFHDICEAGFGVMESAADILAEEAAILAKSGSLDRHLENHERHIRLRNRLDAFRAEDRSRDAAQ